VGAKDELFDPQKYLKALAEDQPHAEIRIVRMSGIRRLRPIRRGSRQLRRFCRTKPYEQSQPPDQRKKPLSASHAHNPVDWYPWGDEAFARARLEDKPIFLSVGYSTCHWCHVMERESFEDAEVAALLNDAFINTRWTARSARTSTRFT
jgi:hypothetical protein